VSLESPEAHAFGNEAIHLGMKPSMHLSRRTSPTSLVMDPPVYWSR
jgi:hypothetical protein